MGDRASTHIQIGGTLPAEHYDEFCQIIADYVLTPEWDGDAFDPHTLNPDQPIELFGHELNGGYAPELEAFAIEHGLVYWRWSGGCLGAYEPAIAIHDSIDAAPRTFLATESEYPVAAIADLRAMTSIAELKAWIASSEFDVPAFRLSH